MATWTLRNLTVQFGSTVAVDGVDLSLAPGDRVALVGASGSGKTSLVRAGLGLQSCTGQIEILGEPTAKWSHRDWLAARRKVQLLFQDPRASLHPAIPIGAALAESAALHRPETPIDTAVDAALVAVGLQGRAHAWPHELSGGEQRRASIARIWMSRPSLLVVDEPTTGLDAALKADLLQLILDSVHPDCAICMVTHDLPLVAWAAHTVLVMEQGRIVDRFSPSEALSDTRHPASRALWEAVTPA
jgi:ABC-type glutathione transport system ATPase component